MIVRMVRSDDKHLTDSLQDKRWTRRTANRFITDGARLGRLTRINEVWRKSDTGETDSVNARSCFFAVLEKVNNARRAVSMATVQAC